MNLCYLHFLLFKNLQTFTHPIIYGQSNPKLGIFLHQYHFSRYSNFILHFPYLTPLFCLRNHFAPYQKHLPFARPSHRHLRPHLPIPPSFPITTPRTLSPCWRSPYLSLLPLLSRLRPPSHPPFLLSFHRRLSGRNLEKLLLDIIKPTFVENVS